MRLSRSLGVLLLSAATALLTPAAARAETLRWTASRAIGSLDPDSWAGMCGRTSRMWLQLPDNKVRLWMTRMGS